MLSTWLYFLIYLFLSNYHHLSFIPTHLITTTVKLYLYNLLNYYHLTFIPTHLVTKMVQSCLYNHVIRKYFLASSCMLYFFIEDEKTPIFIIKDSANFLLSLSFEKSNNKEAKNLLARKNKDYIHTGDPESLMLFKSLKSFSSKRNIAISWKCLKEYVMLKSEYT